MTVIKFKQPKIKKQRGGAVSVYCYQRIRDMREDSDKKQAELACVLGITTQQYQLYESGKREIPVHHLITLSKFYNVSTDYLLGLISFPEPLNRKAKR